MMNGPGIGIALRDMKWNVKTVYAITILLAVDIIPKQAGKLIG